MIHTSIEREKAKTGTIKCIFQFLIKLIFKNIFVLYKHSCIHTMVGFIGRKQHQIIHQSRAVRFQKF